MIGIFEGLFTGAEVKQSTKTGNTYCIVRTLEENGKGFEFMTSDGGIINEILNLKKLVKYRFWVDCTQGTYTRFNLVKYELLKV